jgi:hypothetical protein
MARSLRSLSNTTSYSAIFFVHMFVSFVNCNGDAYLNSILESDIRIVAGPAPALP